MRFIKMYKEYIVIGAFTGMLSGLVMILTYVIITGGNLGWGNFPQWLQLFGLFFGFGVTWTIFVKQTSSHLSIAVETRYRRKGGENGSIIISNELEIFSWVTNDGNAAGSFKFVGFIKHQTKMTYDHMEHDEVLKEKIVNQIIDPDPEFLVKDRNFFKLDPKEVSQTIAFPIEMVKMQFGRNLPKGFSIDICWMDPVGKIYHREIIIK